MLESCVKHELETLQEISKITAKEIKEEVGCAIFLQSGQLTQNMILIRCIRKEWKIYLP